MRRLIDRSRLTGRGSRRLEGGCGVAEILACCAYRGMIHTEHGGAGGRDAHVVPAGLVAVAQLVRDGSQLVRQGQHERVRQRPPALPGGERLLQHPAGGTRLVRLPVQPSQQVRGAQDIRMILAERRPSRLERVTQQLTGGGKVARPTQCEGTLLGDGQGRGMGHVAHAAGCRRCTATRPAGPVRTRPGPRPVRPGRAADADVHDPSAACTVTPRAARWAAFGWWTTEAGRVGWTEQVRVAEWQTR